MKIGELTDSSIEEPKSQVIIQLGNGQELVTTDYYHDTNVRGERTTVIRTGRKIKRSLKNNTHRLRNLDI